MRSNSPPRLFGVTIQEFVPRYPSGTGDYPLDVLLFAEHTYAEANAAGRRTAEEYTARSLHPHGWKVEVFCPCCIRGTTYRGRTCEPGYRRKPCSFCDGTGRITS